MFEPIYLDYHATTPVDERVVHAMLPYLTHTFGNPSGEQGYAGRLAAAAVEDARSQIAELIAADAGELVFTAGATESNNLALLGLAGANSSERQGIVTITTEHKSVLAPALELQRRGIPVTVLNVDSNGRVDLDLLAAVVSDSTYLISIQAANNEVGTIQDIPGIAEIAHARGALFHCDGAQAVGRIPVDVNLWDVDLMSISAHKLYAPKGVGALYIRGGPNSVPIQPLMFGGGQERGIRPGTLNVPAIVGFGVAAQLCMDALAGECERIADMRDRLEAKLLRAFPLLHVNGDQTKRLPGNSSVTFPFIDAEALIVNCPGIALSTGSACTSGAPEPSYVLLALGLSREEAYQTLRIGLGRFTTPEQVDRSVQALTDAALQIQSIASA